MGSLDGWRGRLESLAVTLFPQRCGGCDATLVALPRFGLCEPCFDTLEPNNGSRCTRCDLPGPTLCSRCSEEPPPFASLRAPYLYGGPLQELLVAAKFRGREDLAVAVGRLVVADADAQRLAADAASLVPVPLSRQRGRQRGYNQSAIIARVLGAAWKKPVAHALVRTRDTAPQSDLSLQQRRDNVDGAFAARKRLSGPVVLVDDVVTSGETVRQAAAALQRAAPEPVRIIAVARAETILGP